MASKAMLEQGAARRAQMVSYVRDYVSTEGRPPTIQEIGDAVALVSPNATRNHLMRLQDEGFITMTPRSARSVVPVDPGPDGWTARG